VSGTSGNSQVSVSWTAPASNGGAAITDYVVQYSTSASSGFATFSDGTSTATTATVTGLTNGTSYYFKVAATNSVGTGNFSDASATVTPAPPVNNGYVSFSYMETLISQQVVVSDMANTNSQTIAFKARYCAYGPDTLSVYVNLYNSGGDVLASRVVCPHAALTDSYQTFSCAITEASTTPLAGGLTWSQIGRITVQVYGDDSENWGGNYGPVVDYVSLVAAKTNGSSTEQLLNHDFNTVTSYAPNSWTISSGTWAACEGLYTSSLCVGFADTPFHENYTVGTRTLTIDSTSYVSSYRMVVTPPTITSTASAGTGTKTYSSSTTSVCTIDSSTGVVAFVSVGTCTIGASIAADSSYITATASAVSFSVVYEVGDTGAGGGVVFYVQASGGTFTSTGSACNTAGVGGISTCKYLEAAPSGWIVALQTPVQTNCITAGTSTVDPRCAWSGNTNAAIGATARGTAIGSGYANTTAIINLSNTAGKAATVTRAYQGGSKTDWFLPSRDELNELCKYAANTGQASGSDTVCTGRGAATERGFSTDIYWSSSETEPLKAWGQYFWDGVQNNTSKHGGYYVRPVRAG